MISVPTFHPGELIVQRRAGTRGVADELSPGLDTALPEGGTLNPLLHSLRFLALSSVEPPSDHEDKHSVWVSVAFGEHFVSSPSPDTITVNLDGFSSDDVLFENTAKTTGDTQVGIVALHLPTRRRYRTNGIVQSLPKARSDSSAVLKVLVKEAFPNCPKYIQIRDVTPATSPLPPVPEQATFETDVALSSEDEILIQRADTFLLGTYYDGTGADANHRGGRPGFVRVVSDTELFWPDYRGNGMFQSFGNLQLDDRAGITFIDFETGQMLQLSGSATVEWDIDESLGVEPSALRIVRFRTDKVRRSLGPATNYRWSRPEYSPYNPSLPQEEGQMNPRSGLFPMTVSLVKITAESPIVKTYRFLAPRRISFLPGQYATFDFGAIRHLGTGSEPIVRTWTLSEVSNSTEGDLTLEVSVKRKVGGIMSNWLHDHAQVGLQARLLGVGGEMTPFDRDTLPEKMLFISGGIGITPNMAILRGIGARTDPRETVQPDIVFVHQERDEVNIPFIKELSRRARISRGRTKLIKLISGECGKVAIGEKEDATASGEIQTCYGRLEQEFLSKNVPDIEARVVFLCGPVAFMESVKRMLGELQVPSSAIVTEQFNF